VAQACSFAGTLAASVVVYPAPVFNVNFVFVTMVTNSLHSLG
jgi:hypothetical protein